MHGQKYIHKKIGINSVSTLRHLKIDQFVPRCRDDFNILTKISLNISCRF